MKTKILKGFQILISIPLIEYHQNVEIVKSKFKSEKSNKNKHKQNVVLTENKKKRD